MREKARVPNLLRSPRPTVVVLVSAVVYGLSSNQAHRSNGTDLLLAFRAQDVLTALVVLWLGLMFYLADSYAIH